MFGFTSRPRGQELAAQPQQKQSKPEGRLSAGEVLQAVLWEGVSPAQAQREHQDRLRQRAMAERQMALLDEAARFAMGGGMGGGMAPAPVDNRAVTAVRPDDFTSAGYDVATPRAPPMAGGQMPMGGGMGGQGRTGTSRDFLPFELGGIAAGVPQLGQMADTLRKYDPKLDNNFMIMPGGRVGMLEGTTDAIAATEAAKAAAAALGQQSVLSQFNLRETPAGDGFVTETQADALRNLRGGGGGNLPPGYGYRPGPAQVATDTARGVGQVERELAEPAKEAARTAQTAALDEMEGLLPNVIAGFGADQRLTAARLAAALGDKDAQQRVAATETYLNQGRILVGAIIKTFGSNPTEGERKFTEQMSGADADLNPKTLQMGIELARERLAREAKAPLPMPKDTRRLVPGAIYQTRMGPGRWNGKEFEAP